MDLIIFMLILVNYSKSDLDYTNKPTGLESTYQLKT